MVPLVFLYINLVCSMLPNQDVKPLNTTRNKYELKIQTELAQYLGGQMEVLIPEINGRADIVTPHLVVEVKMSDWKKALGQVLSYGYFLPNHEKVVYLFNPKTSLEGWQILPLFKKYGVTLVIQHSLEGVDMDVLEHSGLMRGLSSNLKVSILSLLIVLGCYLLGN